MWRFKVDYDQGGKACWWLYAENNELVAWSGQSFASLSNAQRAADEFKVGAKTARYDVYLDAGRSWRWRASRSSDKVAASGQSFASHASAERAAQRVHDNAGSASSQAAWRALDARC